VPAYLSAVPIDPFDKLPLRLRARPEGLLIYSVGPDGQDNGGHIDRQKPGPGTDLGFQLWHSGQRHRGVRPGPKLTTPTKPGN
jgi:hypothetical protein